MKASARFASGPSGHNSPCGAIASSTAKSGWPLTRAPTDLSLRTHEVAASTPPLFAQASRTACTAALDDVPCTG